MVTFANILAVAILSLAPFVRPCYCGEFELVCQCATEEAEAEETPAEPARPSCCGEQEDETEQQPENEPAPEPDDAPCGSPFSAEVYVPVLEVTPASIEAAPTITAVLPAPLSIVPVAAVVEFSAYSRPPPICLQVVSTHFLRI